MRRWAPRIFATFWVVLAGFSGAYLYSALNEPAASHTVATEAPAMQAPVSNPADTAKIAALQHANDDQAQALDTANATIKKLSNQVASLNKRLKPIEKLLGPVAAMPAKPPVVTAPPSPTAEADAAPPVSHADDEKPAQADDTKTASTEPTPPKPAAKPEEPAASEVPHGVVPLPPQRPKASAAADAKAKEKPVETASVTPPPPAPPSPPAMSAPDFPAGTTRFGIELGAVQDQSALRPMWRDLLTNHAALVAGLEAREVMAPNKQWRLVAGPFSSASEATQACALFKKVELNCAPTVFAGDPL